MNKFILRKSLFTKSLGKCLFKNEIGGTWLYNNNFYNANSFYFCDNGRTGKTNNINEEEDEEMNDYQFLDKKYIHLENNFEISSILKNMKCQGCGIHLQIENKNKIGFIPEKKFKDYLNGKKNDTTADNTENTSEHLNAEENTTNTEEELKEFEQIHDKATLRKIKKLKHTKSILICERCYKLKNYMNFDSLNNKTEKDINLNERKENYTSVVKLINDQRLIHQIMTRISNKAHIFYLLDIAEIEATLNNNILKEVIRKNIGITFIVNKFDILPTKVIEERVRIWVGELLRDLTVDLKGLDYSYILVSSKNGHNFDYVIHKIKLIKEKAKEDRIPRPKIFVVGNANVGKSSFINKLIERSHRYIDERRLGKLKYKKDFNINDKSVFEENENNNLPREESHLTTSPLPGTTIGITKIESMRMGVKLFDTPGIPNKHSINYFMDNYTDIISSAICQKIIPFTCSIKQGYSIWIGAIARVDFLNGEDKYLSFFFSQHVTIHRTPLLNAEDLFAKQAGKLLRPAITTDINELNLVKHVFNLKCELFSLLNFDIVISGLGWFSVSGKGLVQIEVNVPNGVEVYLRNKPIMPYEIKSRGVKKFFGKTVGANSKINREFNHNKPK